MTEEYKKNILKWLVGKYSKEETKTTMPIYHNLTSTTENFYTELCEKYDAPKIIDILETKCQENELGIMVVYGNLGSNGFICIIDEKGKAKQIITEYSTGTKLKPFVTLQVGEDGTFYEQLIWLPLIY